MSPLPTGDSRNPAKHEIKNIYLDGIGEAQDSPRRSSTNGIQWRYSLNSGGSSSGGGGRRSSRRIDVVLLDGRYFRETMPCSMHEARYAACGRVHKYCPQLCDRAMDAALDPLWVHRQRQLALYACCPAGAASDVYSVPKLVLSSSLLAGAGVARCWQLLMMMARVTLFGARTFCSQAG